LFGFLIFISTTLPLIQDYEFKIYQLVSFYCAFLYLGQQFYTNERRVGSFVGFSGSFSPDHFFRLRFIASDYYGYSQNPI
jgi:hypothetical protein